MIGIKILYFDQKADLTPDYSKKFHIETIEGETPEECMETLRIKRDHNDITKYSPLEIIDVYSC